MIRPVALVILALIAPAGAQACEPIPVPELRNGPDSPAVLYSDGSFQQAGADDWWEFLEGRPARDIGGGRVGQVIVAGLGSCFFYESLLFVDCTTAESILVDGIPPPAESDTPGAPGPMSPSLEGSARALQPPYGPLALTSATTVAEIAAIAAREGWTVRTDLAAFAVERGAQNAFDPFIGCRIFYQNLPGSQPWP
jgi:hypothetical protein